MIKLVLEKTEKWLPEESFNKVLANLVHIFSLEALLDLEANDEIAGQIGSSFNSSRNVLQLESLRL